MVSCHDIAAHLGCILLKMPAISLLTGNRSTIHRWDGQKLALWQTVPSHAGHAWRSFEMDGAHFLALANYRVGFAVGDPNGWPQGPWFTRAPQHILLLPSAPF